MSRFRITGLRSRILFLMLLAMLPALVLVLATAIRARQERADRVQEEALQLALLAVDRYDELIQGARQLEETLGSLPFVVAGEQPACNELLATILEQNAYYSGIFVLNPRGDLICSAPPSDTPMNVADRDYFQEALAERRFFVGPYLTGRITGRPTLPSVYPVVDSDRTVQAVLVTGLDLGWLTRLNTVWDTEEQTIVVFDDKGTVLSRHPHGSVAIGDHSDAPIIRHVLASPTPGTTQAEGVDGIEKLYGYAPLSERSENNVFVAVGIPITAAYAPATRELLFDLTILLLILSCLALAWLFGEMLIMRRVDLMMATTQALASGDLNARTNVGQVWGELDHLAQTLDEMATSLQQEIEEHRETEARLHHLARRLATAQEEERRLLARELHDNAGQLVTVLAMRLQMLQSDLADSASDLHETLAATRSLTENLGQELRDLSHSLRPPTLDQLGLNVALELLCEEFAEHTKLSTTYEGTTLPELPESVAISCYRFVQEALNNVAKHAQARHVAVELSHEVDALTLTIVDDGVGFAADAAPGMGLLSMRERIEGIEGELEITSSSAGTRLSAQVPLPEAPEQCQETAHPASGV